MADSTHPLDADEWSRLESFLDSYLKPFTAYNNFDPARVVLWIARTGTHPCVLAFPGKHNLRVYETPAGLTASWDRPKKRGMNAATLVPLKDERVCSWAREFVAELYLSAPSLSTIHRAVRDVGRQAGVVLSPRCLRHTFLRWVADRTRDPTAVMALGNVSGRVAMGYTMRARVEEYRAAL